MNNQIFDVIILGAGPAGIATAYEAEQLGFKKILILEKTNHHSHTIRNFYEDGKSIDRDWGGFKVELLGNIDFKFVKEQKLDLFEEILNESKIIDVIYDSEVYLIEKKNELFNIESKSGSYIAKNVVIAIGRMAKPKKPDYRLPRKLAKKINFDLSKVSCDEKILVVGGGDSASEYAVSLSKNNDVTITYRKEKFTRPNPINQQKLKEKFESGDLKYKLGVDIKEIIDENGLIKIIYTDDTNDTYERMIFALGGTTPMDFIKNSGIEVDALSQPIFDENNETIIIGLFVAGDIVFQNGGSISVAFNQGYKIAKFITKS
jgi:thioredoxin reductase (NADPH)